MNPIELEITISRPPEEVFAYLADIANHPEFSDHYLKQWHLTRIDSVGRGAGARFRVAAPLQRFNWADMTFVEVDPPRRILAFGRGGKFNRIEHSIEWELEPAAGGTRVRFALETEPRLPTDRIMEAFGLRGWFKRNASRGLRRLRSILEDGAERGERATVGGL